MISASHNPSAAPVSAGHASRSPVPRPGRKASSGRARNAPPVVYSSDTSHIGGNTCTFTVESTWDPTGTQSRGSSYGAAAQSWSISSCVPGIDPTTGQPICTADPAHSYSSAAGSAPAGSVGSLVAGEQVTVTVSNGFVIAGTPNGDGTS